MDFYQFIIRINDYQYLLFFRILGVMMNEG